MKNFFFIMGGLFALLIIGHAQLKSTKGVEPIEEKPLAFPGAEGYGKFTSGGRGGKVIIVKNLDDDGPGSFREAVTAREKRIVVFAISGTIHLNSSLTISSDVTIAGQSAPGDGICIADYPVLLGGNNIIIRYLRLRMGDKNQNKGKVNGSGNDDSFSGTKRNNIIIDHCSLSWSNDEVLSVYAGDSTTLQWNLIAEPLNYSYHFETGDNDYEQHGYGGIWGGRHLSAHHNLFAHCKSRTPRFDGIRNNTAENVDFRNNVIYNWNINNVYGGEGGTYNIVNNYYKYGPSTMDSVKFRICNPYKKPPTISFGKYFIEGNYVDGSPQVTKNNWIGVIMEKGSEPDAMEAKLKNAFPIISIPTQNAIEAYRMVIKNVGAILPKRDSLDKRIIGNLINRTGKMIDVQGGYPHGTSYELSASAWPVLKYLPAPKDTDQDGMPDAWEVTHALNPSKASDANTFSLNKSYTNIEIYLNEFVKHELN